jgi:peptide/nickel transport system permease protein
VIERLLKRIGWAVFVVWAVVTLTFFVNNVLPSDPARMVAGPQARPQDVARIRQQLGLDRPAHVQYALFLRRLVHTGPPTFTTKDPEHGTCANLGRVHFDLGRSYQLRKPVVAVLAERLPRTIMLALAAVLIQVSIGVSSGVLAALKRNRLLDHLTVGASLLGISAPTFILGIFLQFVLAHRLRLLPLDGYGKTDAEHLVSLVLPALTLGMFGAAYYTRLVRDEMIGLMKQDYVRTARAKGLSTFAVVVRHALRNALVPLVTVVGLELGALVGGAIVTETLFRWPGIGSLSVTALLDRDGPIVVGTVLVTSVAVVTSSIVVDFLYALLDPRVRLPARR